MTSLITFMISCHSSVAAHRHRLRIDRTLRGRTNLRARGVEQRQDLLSHWFYFFYGVSLLSV